MRPANRQPPKPSTLCERLIGVVILKPARLDPPRPATTAHRMQHGRIPPTRGSFSAFGQAFAGACAVGCPCRTCFLGHTLAASAGLRPTVESRWRSISSSRGSGRCWSRTVTSATRHGPETCRVDFGSTAARRSAKGASRGRPSRPATSMAACLIRALRYEDHEMPPKGKLPPSAIADFAQWVRMGAPDPRDRPDSDPPQPAEPSRPRGRRDARSILTRRASTGPISRSARRALPAVKNTGWAKTEIDRFVLARLEAAGLVAVARLPIAAR